MSNNHPLSTTTPTTTRELISQLIANNLHIIETRSVCLISRAQLIVSAAADLKDRFHAMGDVMSAPFLRLGKRFLESPITCEIAAASREFNNTLIAAKLHVSTQVRVLSTTEGLAASARRTIDRLGLRLSVIKLEITELIEDGEAGDEASGQAPHRATNQTTAQALKPPTTAAAAATSTIHASASPLKPVPQPPSTAPAASLPSRTTNSATHSTEHTGVTTAGPGPRTGDFPRKTLVQS